MTDISIPPICHTGEHTYILAHIYTCTHIHMHTYTRAHIHTNSHAHMIQGFLLESCIAITFFLSSFSTSKIHEYKYFSEAKTVTHFKIPVISQSFGRVPIKMRRDETEGEKEEGKGKNF